MNDLIKIENITIGDETVPTVNARELHEFLDVNTRFNDWVTKRIKDYSFIENQDFLTFTENSVKGQTGRPTKEYYISIDMAKELAMVERNEKGREARQYFIKCEKQLRQQQASEGKYILDIVMANSVEQRALALGNYRNNFVEPLIEFKEQALPKVDFYDTVTASEKIIDIGDTSKVLLFKGLGRNNLFKVLRELEILDKDNVPYQKYVSRGYFKLIETVINGKPYIKTGVYQKGLDFLNKTLANAGYKKLPR